MTETEVVDLCATAWLNGELLPTNQPLLRANDHGLVVGDGVFETLLVTPTGAFGLRRHLNRLRESAAALQLSLPDDDALRTGVNQVVEANKGLAGIVRITVTGGAGPLGTHRGESPSTVLITAAPERAWAETAEVAVVPWPRNERGAMAGVKTISYAENVRALQHAHETGATEAIFANTAGNLCEGTGSNIFVVVDDVLTTPPLSSGCLAGITRELIVGMFEVVEANLPIDQLRGVDEAFLSSTTRNVQAIGAVDGTTLAAAPGPKTKEVAARFELLASHDTDP